MEFESAHANRGARQPKRGLEIKTGAEPLHSAGWNIRLRDMAGKIFSSTFEGRTRILRSFLGLHDFDLRPPTYFNALWLP